MEALSPTSSFRIAIDARCVREKPSGISAYVRALAERLPVLAPNNDFLFWAHPLAPRPLSLATNTRAVTMRAGPNSPWPVLWPQRYAPFAEIDVFHSPHNMMPRALPCASVVTVHDVMAIDEPGMHLQGAQRFVKSAYYRQAIWRALRHATRLVAQSRATADRICALVPEAAKRLSVIGSAPEAMACGCPVVASDIPPLREVTAGTAFLFPAGDFQALARALRDFVSTPSLRQSLSEQGYARAKDFSWDDNARATLQVYRDAATARR